MLFQVLDPLCCHLDLGAWGKLAQTCKRAKSAIDHPLYWDGRYGKFRNEVLSMQAELHVYKTAECHCVTNIWTGPRALSGVYAVSIPVLKSGDTKGFIRYLIEEMHFLNYDLLPHMGQRSRSEHIVVKLPVSQWQKDGYVVAGKLKLIPYMFSAEDCAEKNPADQVTEVFEILLDEADNNTRTILDEIVDELEPDDFFQGPTPPVGGHCPDCGRQFEDDGFGGNFMVVGF